MYYVMYFYIQCTLLSTGPGWDGTVSAHCAPFMLHMFHSATRNPSIYYADRSEHFQHIHAAMGIKTFNIQVCKYLKLQGWSVTHTFSKHWLKIKGALGLILTPVLVCFCSSYDNSALTESNDWNFGTRQNKSNKAKKMTSYQTGCKQTVQVAFMWKRKQRPT